MEQECVQFYLKINSWKVILPSSNGVKDEDLPVTAMSGNGSVTGENDAIVVPQTSSSSCSTNDTMVMTESNSTEYPKHQRPPAKKGQFLLKRLQLQDISDNQQETEDKFSSIKMRRSSNRPLIPLPSKVKGKRMLPMPIKEEPTQVETVVNIVTESTAQPEDKMLSMLQSSDSQLTYIHESPDYGMDSLTDSFTVPPDIDMTIFPQLEGVAEIIVPPTSPIKTDEDYVVEHKLRVLTVTLTRLDPYKMQKILGNRMPLLKKITKSGRILKPKDRLDPSHKKRQKRQENFNKIKILSKRKSHAETEKKLRKNRSHEDKGKELSKKRSHDSTEQKIHKKRGRKQKFVVKPEEVVSTQWDVPDDIPMDIIEDYVEYSSDTTPVEYNVTVQDDAVLQESEKIEIEFLSPSFKHKGKVVIDGKLFNIVSRMQARRRNC